MWGEDTADVTESGVLEDTSAALTESETEQTEEAAVITETELTEETETASEIETDEGVTETEAEEPPEEPPVNITNSVNADDVPSLADTVPFTYIKFEVDMETFMPDCTDEVPEELVSSARQVLADNEFIGYDPDNSEVQLAMYEDYLVDELPQAKKAVCRIPFQQTAFWRTTLSLCGVHIFCNFCKVNFLYWQIVLFF